MLLKRKKIRHNSTQKKPLIAGTKKLEKLETTKKSKYYNKKDFALAKKAVSEMKQLNGLML